MSLAESVRTSLSALKHLKHPVALQDERAQSQIVRYLTLIAKWNRHYNLTAIKTLDAMLIQHIMDSLAIVEHLEGPIIVDVGTGAGLPGIPIAIARPDWQVILIESNQKKAAFLQQVKIELALTNSTVIAERVENATVDQCINTIVSRAFTSLGNFIKTTQHLTGAHSDQCRWMAMKGSCAQQELDEVTAPYHIENKIPLTVPGLAAARELIVIRRTDCINPYSANRE